MANANVWQEVLLDFSDMPDPRVQGRCRHELFDIIAITLVGVTCDLDDWEDIATLAEYREDWFRTWLRLPNGVPSHDTLERVFSLLDPKEFTARLATWAGAVRETVGATPIAIDGKTLRGSHDTKKNQRPVHLVSAWAHEAGLVLGQVRTEEKSNEITAIPELLRQVDVKNCTVTVDAMGCQKEIAGQIVEQGGDYVLALKENQAGLKAEAEAFFAEIEGRTFDDCRQRHLHASESGHGRDEVRDYWLAEDFCTGGRKTEWPGLRCFGKVRTQRTMDGKTSEDVRYYITSLPCRIRDFAKAVRGHWGIENRLHWQLDVTFREDASRIRKGHAAENMAIIRRMVLCALKRVPGPKPRTSLKSKRRIAGWSNDFLFQVLAQF